MQKKCTNCLIFPKYISILQNLKDFEIPRYLNIRHLLERRQFFCIRVHLPELLCRIAWLVLCFSQCNKVMSRALSFRTADLSAKWNCKLQKRENVHIQTVSPSPCCCWQNQVFLHLATKIGQFRHITWKNFADITLPNSMYIHSITFFLLCFLGR